MSVVSVRARSFILALFIRDDGERFLLGDNGFDFKDSQLHFSANTIENDEVEKQGVDGVMLAGQVRRASVQSFDGYVGDATTLKEEVEQLRRDFFAFFAKGHYFRVIYIDCNKNAWQRKGGYLVDAPEVKELWQIHPEYHVGLNFEDVNYYEYDENAEGEEILSNIISVPISSDVEGGLVWDENGAVSEPAVIEYDTETASASGKSISVSDAVEAPLADFKLKGETSQETYSGKNLLQITQTASQTKNGVTVTFDGSSFALNGTTTASTDLYIHGASWGDTTKFVALSAGTYTLSVRKADMSLGANFGAKMYNNSGTSQRIFDFNANSGAETTTLNADSGFTNFYITINSGQTFNNERFYAQLEEGSTATSYEPYTNGPAPNPDYPQAVQTVTGENTLTISDGTNTQSYEVNLGKNLFDKDNAPECYFYINGNNLVAFSGQAVSTYMRIEPNTTYTVTKPILSNNRFGIGTCSSEPVAGGTLTNSIQNNNAGSLTITSGATDKYLVIYFKQGYDTTPNSQIFRQIQAELGSTATSYAAYFEPIELCKIGDYQDYIYKSGDKWYAHKEISKIIEDGSQTWYRLSTAISGKYMLDTGITGMLPATSLNVAPPVFCTRFTPKPFNDLHDNGTIGISSRQVGRDGVYIFDNVHNTAAAFQTWLQTNPMTIYYALATPTDTEITNEALVAQLEAILSQGYTYAGTNNITTVITAGNEQGELEITYYTKYDAKAVGGGYVWEAGGSGGPTIVMNESISEVSPVWTVFGPALNPMLENTTTGEQIQYVGMISEGQTLVVDMGEQTARLDGLNVISNIVGDYLTLAPGSNTLLFSAEGDAPASEIGWSEIVG